MRMSENIILLKEVLTMAKTKEELKAIKEKIEALKEELSTLTEEELLEVSGGILPIFNPLPNIKINPDEQDTAGK